MGGLIFFAILIAWFCLSLWLARKITAWLPTDSTIAKFVVGVLAFALILPLPLIDEIIGKVQFDKLCREEAGVKIYGKLELGPEFFNADGTPNFVDKKTNLIVPDKAMDSYVEFVTMPLQSIASPAKLFKMQLQVRSRIDGQTLAQKTAFAMDGGWLSYDKQSWLPRSGCVKGNERRGEIVSQLVIQKQRK